MKTKEEAKIDAGMYYKLFSTAEGQVVLEDMKRAFLNREIALDGLDLLSIGKRQGEANVVRGILKQIEFAKE